MVKRGHLPRARFPLFFSSSAPLFHPPRPPRELLPPPPSEDVRVPRWAMGPALSIKTRSCRFRQSNGPGSGVTTMKPALVVAAFAFAGLASYRSTVAAAPVPTSGSDLVRQKPAPAAESDGRVAGLGGDAAKPVGGHAQFHSPAADTRGESSEMMGLLEQPCSDDGCPGSDVPGGFYEYAPGPTPIRFLTDDNIEECQATVAILEASFIEDCSDFGVLAGAADDEEDFNKYCSGKCHAYHVFVLGELSKHCDLTGVGKSFNAYVIKQVAATCSKNPDTGRLCYSDFREATGSFAPQNNEANDEFLCSSPCGFEVLYPRYKFFEVRENAETGRMDSAWDPYKICFDRRHSRLTKSAAKTELEAILPAAESEPFALRNLERFDFGGYDAIYWDFLQDLTDVAPSHSFDFPQEAFRICAARCYNRLKAEAMIDWTRLAAEAAADAALSTSPSATATARPADSRISSAAPASENMEHSRATSTTFPFVHDRAAGCQNSADGETHFCKWVRNKYHWSI
ncbi:MAG: hypothetical protein BJ554DRAFT_5679 [Olpidium bornovanus]|uniref:Uncharacterized protein n=1 Tax=Olpidium bornovanus TaxID=278681 RepID=A0A8H8DKU8_9FUNG|nr:MAG: hypothetical protein BJ554DRAFT_5679 [Olpidium bornovanus]